MAPQPDQHRMSGRSNFNPPTFDGESGHRLDLSSPMSSPNEGRRAASPKLMRPIGWLAVLLSMMAGPDSRMSTAQSTQPPYGTLAVLDLEWPLDAHTAFGYVSGADPLTTPIRLDVHLYCSDPNQSMPTNVYITVYHDSGAETPGAVYAQAASSTFDSQMDSTGVCAAAFILPASAIPAASHGWIELQVAESAVPPWYLVSLETAAFPIDIAKRSVRVPALGVDAWVADPGMRPSPGDRQGPSSASGPVYAIPRIAASPGIRVFANATQVVLQAPSDIAREQPVILRLYDLSGKLLLSLPSRREAGSASREYRFALPRRSHGIPYGVYFARFSTPEGTFSFAAKLLDRFDCN